MRRQTVSVSSNSIVVTLTFTTIVIIPPFYDWFCRVTGYGGTPSVRTEAANKVLDEYVTVRFDSNIDSSLPWRVTAAKPLSGRIGEVETVVFTARNLSDKTVTGEAVFKTSTSCAEKCSLGIGGFLGDDVNDTIHRVGSPE